MSWTKRQLVSQAFEEIGLAAYVFDLTPEQLNSAMRRMDAMLAGWNANGIRLGYTLPFRPGDGSLDGDSGIPDWAQEAVFLGLAVRLAPAFGKTVSPETKMFADMAYGNMVNNAALPTIERELPRTMPRGSGTKPWRNFNNPFVYGPVGDTSIDAGPDGNLTFE